LTGDEIRAKFLAYFEEKGHKVIPSSSLIPHGDPTLLLTTAGMVQLKPYFMGQAKPPHARLASCQKCFRTTDIESVGDASHLTFFEMLGNFSVGDYFKAEAIAFAWEFITVRLGIPKEKLWTTVYLDDKEAVALWRKMGVPAERIVRLGEEDNFWGPAGDSGPCGPCSEIHYDFGEAAGCGKADCNPSCKCGRFCEIWNLVFIQFYQDKQGGRTPLPKPNIDTGMGLERVTAVMQGKGSVYETDLLAPLVERVAEIAGKSYGDNPDSDNAIRVVAEHGRGIAFLIADGVLPGNEKQGYVLRRLMRRAIFFGDKLGAGKPFLAEVARITIGKMKHAYPELGQRKDFILKVIKEEEARFGETLSTGLNFTNAGLQELAGSLATNSAFTAAVQQAAQQLEQIQRAMPPPAVLQAVQQAAQQLEQIQRAMPPPAVLQVVQQAAQQVEQIRRLMPPPAVLQAVQQAVQQYESFLRIPGEDVFKLYDTYGFPMDLTREVARKQGFSVDIEGFEREMNKQREKARAAHKFGDAEKGGAKFNGEFEPTRFTGYSALKESTRIVGIIIANEGVNDIATEQKAGIVLADTPFYAEMGGQVGDTGIIRAEGGLFTVTNTVKLDAHTTLHQGYVSEGSFSVGDAVTAEVDAERRADIARNHTATHLLHYALRQVLGEHVQQRGSLVEPLRLRFDFSHLAPLTAEEISKIQDIVNAEVRHNHAVYDKQMSYKEAVAVGAIALFDEKYGDVVRVLSIGRPAISTELCGGTHVSASGEIGFFEIVSESSIGSGLRRIEAVTGREAARIAVASINALQSIGKLLDSAPEGVLQKVQALLDSRDAGIKRAEALEREMAL